MCSDTANDSAGKSGMLDGILGKSGPGFGLKTFLERDKHSAEITPNKQGRPDNLTWKRTIVQLY